jgi:hypothetical protein
LPATKTEPHLWPCNSGPPAAQVGIGCYECHQADKTRPDAFDHFGYSISVMVTPKSCGTCHAQQAAEFQASHHAQAGQILGSLDNVLGEDVEGPAAAAMGCKKCHGSEVANWTRPRGPMKASGA